jgi:hypothetical protein
VHPGMTYSITIGQGGEGGSFDGSNGGDSSFGSDPALVAVGGGGGMSYNIVAGSFLSSGGSGGGGAAPFGLLLAQLAGFTGTSTAVDGQGFPGGEGQSGVVVTGYGDGNTGGGGGGAGWWGGDGSLRECNGRLGGAGGPGLQFTFNGSPAFFAFGGGGADMPPASSPECVSTGAPDGSGRGNGPSGYGADGAPNTGGGGGGGWGNFGGGGHGGSGIVILRY